MILHLDSADTDNLGAARADLAALAASWRCELTEPPLQNPGDTEDRHDRGVDPVALTALSVSLPSAALAATDLTDRIRKRLRARQLLDHAQRLANHHVTIRLAAGGVPIDITTLDPDQLLDLINESALSPTTRTDVDRPTPTT